MNCMNLRSRKSFSILKNWKAQSAIEYLMTYGWMLLVVAIAGAAVFSVVGTQSIESVSGFQGQDLAVTDFGATSTGLSMILRSQTHESIEITEIMVQQGEEEIIFPVNTEITASGENMIAIPISRSENGLNELDIELTYDIGSLEGITSSGTIIGDFNLENSIIGNDALAAYWSLNSNYANESHIFDLSENRNHGETNQAYWSDTSRGEYVAFDTEEDGKINIVNEESPNLDLGDSATIFFSIKWGGNHNDRDVITGSGESGSWNIILWRGSDNIAFRHWGDNTFSTNIGPEQGLWEDWAVTIDNGNYTFYREGEKIASESWEDQLSYSGTARIGGFDGSTYETFDGSMGDIIWMDEALEESEIKEYTAR